MAHSSHFAPARGGYRYVIWAKNSTAASYTVAAGWGCFYRPLPHEFLEIASFVHSLLDPPRCGHNVELNLGVDVPPPEKLGGLPYRIVVGAGAALDGDPVYPVPLAFHTFHRNDLVLKGKTGTFHLWWQ